MSFVFEINGEDITEYMNFDGLRCSINDLDSEEAGRTLDGVMHRSRVATKIRWDVQVKKLRTSELQHLFSLIKPEWVTLRCTDLQQEGERTYKAYSNNYAVDMCASGVSVEGEILWNEFSFPLIEE